MNLIQGRFPVCPNFTTKLIFCITGSLFICTLRSDLEGGRKVVLLTWIFSGWRPKKRMVYTVKPAFSRLQNQLSATLKITSKDAD